MRFTPGTVEGVWVVDIEPIKDHRGFFARAWCRDDFADTGLLAEWAQSNIQYSPTPGTLRGIHFQRDPYAEVKLVRCTRGSVFDVAIDLRPDSPTYRDWFGVELSAGTHRAVWVPEGCAHGYVTLEEDSEVFYLTSHAYVPSAVGAVRHDDPAFSIEWPRPIVVTPPGYDDWPRYDGGASGKTGDR